MPHTWGRFERCKWQNRVGTVTRQIVGHVGHQCMSALSGFRMTRCMPRCAGHSIPFKTSTSPVQLARPKRRQECNNRALFFSLFRFSCNMGSCGEQVVLCVCVCPRMSFRRHSSRSLGLLLRSPSATPLATFAAFFITKSDLGKSRQTRQRQSSSLGSGWSAQSAADRERTGSAVSAPAPPTAMQRYAVTRRQMLQLFSHDMYSN